MKQNVVVGGAEQIADQIKAKVLDAGIDGVIIDARSRTSTGTTREASPRWRKALKPLVEG